MFDSDSACRRCVLVLGLGLWQPNRNAVGERHVHFVAEGILDLARRQTGIERGCGRHVAERRNHQIAQQHITGGTELMRHRVSEFAALHLASE